MGRKGVVIAMMALWLLVQMGAPSGAKAEEPRRGAALAWSGHSSPLNPLGQLMNTTLRLIVLSVALCMALAAQAAG